MKVKVLASGSKGNCTLVISKNTKILIDVGITVPQIKNSLDNLQINIESIDGILISHIHTDHIKGLSSIVKRYGLKVYAKPELLYDLVKYIPVDTIEIVNDIATINNIKVQFIETSHDVTSYGFIISDDKASMVYITDTGYINKKYEPITKNKDIYIIETNHDEEMLMNGPYPYQLKQRVISDKGHLSNKYTGKYLTKVIGNNTKYVFLAHISENNNTYDLALEQIKEELSPIHFDEDKIIVTHQNEETEMVEV